MNELVAFLHSIYNKTIIEEDSYTVYIPDLKLAIEYNDLRYFDNVNHLPKFEQYKSNNIRLIQITEWEWKNKNDLIKSFLSMIIKNQNTKIFARNCKISEISNSEYKSFTEKNHLQGWVPASIKIGLYFNNKLVQIMSFGKSRFNSKYDFEMLRECSDSNFTIVGGKSKLLSFFEKKYNPVNLVSYCEKNKFTGKSYIACGFELIGESEPGYYYYKDNQKFHRTYFQKHKLKERLDEFYEELTEYENMVLNGYTRLFDYGNYIFLKRY